MQFSVSPPAAETAVVKAIKEKLLRIATKTQRQSLRVKLTTNNFAKQNRTAMNTILPMQKFVMMVPVWMTTMSRTN